jgi:cell division protein FtsL
VKKIISVFIITILLLATVIVEQVFIDSTLDELVSRIETLNAQIESAESVDTEELRLSIKNLDEFWTEREKILCITINHNDLSRVGEQIKKVRVYIEENNKDDCVYEIDILYFYATSYKHVMEINIQNIL